MLLNSRRAFEIRDWQLAKQLRNSWFIYQRSHRTFCSKTLLQPSPLRCSFDGTFQPIKEVRSFGLIWYIYRYSYASSFVNVSLEDFIQEDDRTVFGSLPSADLAKTNCLRNLADLVNFDINNSFPNLEALYRHLDTIDLLHPEHLRPNWETYFMVCLSIAVQKSQKSLIKSSRLWPLLPLVDPIAWNAE